MAENKICEVKIGAGIGRKIAIVVAALAVITTGLYVSYESALLAVDNTVIALLVVVAVLNVAYFCLSVWIPKPKINIMGLVEIGSTGLAAEALVTYLNSDISNLADLLNGVTIFSGGAGDATTIFILIGLMAAIGILQIVVCFLPTES